MNACCCFALKRVHAALGQSNERNSKQFELLPLSLVRASHSLTREFSTRHALSPLLTLALTLRNKMPRAPRPLVAATHAPMTHQLQNTQNVKRGNKTRKKLF